MSFVLINCLFKSIPHFNEVFCFFAMGLCEFAIFHWYLWIIERMWHHKLLQNQPMEDTCKHNSSPIHISYFLIYFAPLCPHPGVALTTVSLKEFRMIRILQTSNFSCKRQRVSQACHSGFSAVSFTCSLLQKCTTISCIRCTATSVQR